MRSKKSHRIILKIHKHKMPIPKINLKNTVKITLIASISLALVINSLNYVQKPLSDMALILAKLQTVNISSLQESVGTFFTADTTSPTTSQDTLVFNNGTSITDTLNEDTTSEDKAIPTANYKVQTTDKTEDDDGQIVRKTFSASSSSLYVALDNGFVKNQSELSTSEILKLYETPLPFEIEKSEEPQVLIYHTHATESFQTYYKDSFDMSASTRSTDNEKNMVAVGEVLKNQLEAYGITTVHSTEQHDNPSYTKAYDNSRETINEYLEKYPSIKVVLDLHRDAIQNHTLSTAPATEIDGVKLAQLMIISCCDDGSDRIPNYRENLIFSTKLQNQLEKDYPTITRPILFDDRFYNQDLSNGGLLIEFGSHANTLEEAKNSAVCLGNSLAKLLGE